MSASYPTGQDYSEAIQNIRLTLRDSDLCSGRAEQNTMGLPVVISGQYASVFKVTGKSGRRWAVKCFTSPVSERQKRYQKISETLTRLNRPWQVAFDYQTEGILVRGVWYPIVKMEWINATGLIRWVQDHLYDSARLAQAASAIINVALDLESSGLSHGDLQHGNVLVDTNGEIKLIDYDGMFVPGLEALSATERGHRHYQHPERSSQFGPHLDRFSAWIIAASVVALSIDPGLWHELHAEGEEKILFGEADFTDVGNSQTLRALRSTGSSDLASLANLVEGMLKGSIDSVPPVDPAKLPIPAASSPGNALPSDVTGAAPVGVPPWMATLPGAAVGASSQPGTPHAIASAPTAAPIGAGWITTHLPGPPPVQFQMAPVGLRITGGVSLFISILASSALAVSNQIMSAVALPFLILLLFLLAARWSWSQCAECNLRDHARRVARQTSRNAADANKRLQDLENEGVTLQRKEQSALQEMGKKRQGIGALRAQQERALELALKDRLAELQNERTKQSSSLQDRQKKALDLIRADYIKRVLSGESVRSARLDGISDSLLFALTRAGIRTAYDFTGVSFGTYPGGRHKGRTAQFRLRSGGMVRVPGIGEVKSQRIDSWRHAIQSTAQRSAPSSLPHDQAQAFDAELKNIQARIDQEQRQAGQRHLHGMNEIKAKADAETLRLDKETSALRDQYRTLRSDFQGRLNRARTEAGKADFDAAQAKRALDSFSKVTFSSYVRFAIIGRM